MDYESRHPNGPNWPTNSKFATSDGLPTSASTSETTPLLPKDKSRAQTADLPAMNKLFGEKRSSFSPPPLSRYAPAPPPSSVANDDLSTSEEHAVNQHNLTETAIAASPSSSAILPSPSQSRPKLQSLRQRVQTVSPSLTLENSGSVARDHLASERTFLAYVRTSLAIASTGVALVQLFTISASAITNPTSPNRRIQLYARPLGATTVMLGIFVLVLGLVRYFSIQTALTKGKFPVARVSIAFISVALSALVVIVFGVLVGVRR